jgi:hypothetical protein
MGAVIQGVTWSVEIGDVDAYIDLTDYVQGFQVKQGGLIGRVNTGACTIRLDNSEGLFTPGLGNTYSSTDWFAKAIKITAQVDAGGGGQQAVSDVFHGVVRDFKVTDTGHTSYVDIVGNDVLTVAARGPQVDVFSAGFSSSTPKEVVEGMLSNSFDSQDPGVTLPYLGATASPVFVLGDASATPQLRSSALPTASSRQLIDNHVLPSGPFVLYACDTIWSDTFLSDTTFFTGVLIGNTLRKTTPDDGAASLDALDSLSASLGYSATQGSRYNRRRYEFTDDTSDTSKLYFSRVRYDFTNTELANRCTTTSSYTPANTPQAAQSNSSIEKYGVFAKTFPQTVNETTTTAAEVSAFWAIRFRDVEFDILRLSLGSSNADIAANGTAAQKRFLGDLLDIKSGIWNSAEVNISKLRGQTSTDLRSVTIIGRTINVTPKSYSIDLDVRGSSSYGAFILDESRLDQDRIF